MIKRILYLLAVTVGLGLFALPAAAGSDVPASGEVAQIRLLPGWQTERGTHIAALQVVLSPGWKTYWRAPGESGIPPRFDWRGSRNIASVAFHWPTPQVIRQNGMRTIGYEHELILPIELTPAGPGMIVVRAELELGVCQDVCMPMQVVLSADLDAGATPDPRIRAALAAAPERGRDAGVTGVRCEVVPISDGLRVTASIRMPGLGADEVAVFELSDRSIWISEADTARSGATLSATADMVPAANAPFALDRSDVRITVLGGHRAVDIRGCTG